MILLIGSTNKAPETYAAKRISITSLSLTFNVFGLCATNQSVYSHLCLAVDPISGPATTPEAKLWLARTASRRVPPSVDGGPAGYCPRVLHKHQIVSTTDKLFILYSRHIVNRNLNRSCVIFGRAITIKIALSVTVSFTRTILYGKFNR